ncbi:single-strand DNA-binding protein [Flavobacterium sp. CF108]|uniref:single-stranded DNA-binding protein n=1 Tax=Flavobacterium sp. CF108 TaxID=1882758 RepID=UPI00092407BE|nr:single-stranded DNA-binding protein [Flavobacterium sp. CF108]SHH92243.1 single-strand DNA-binding protein [Flavobacterium sp. CF108]
MEITGRITKDASTRKVGDEKQVVNFSIAINDSYKPKGSAEYKQITTFVDCSYWMSVKVAEWLKKGALVQLFGRVGLNTYIGQDGSAMGSLTFHINSFKILAFAKKEDGSVNAGSTPKKQNKSDDPDDLPF